MRVTIGLMFLAFVSARALAQDWEVTMIFIDDYLIDEAFEVALARSAAPAHISEKADVWVLRRDGYHQVAAGTNGFTCLVERSWSSPVGPHRDFFNPKLRAPICYNEEAARTILGDYLRRTELAMGGSTIGEIQETIEREIGTGKLPPPRGVAMSYMLSDGQLLGTETGRFKPHLMFYIPYATSVELGSPPPGCEHVCLFEHAGGPFAALIVPMPSFNEVSSPEPETRGESSGARYAVISSVRATK